MVLQATSLVSPSHLLLFNVNIFLRFSTAVVKSLLIKYYSAYKDVLILYEAERATSTRQSENHHHNQKCHRLLWARGHLK